MFTESEMAQIRLEIKDVSGTEVPTLIVECLKCGEQLLVAECDFQVSRPLHCCKCNQDRYISYKEYVTTCNSLGPQLLAHSVSRRSGCHSRHH